MARVTYCEHMIRADYGSRYGVVPALLLLERAKVLRQLLCRIRKEEILQVPMHRDHLYKGDI